MEAEETPLEAPNWLKELEAKREKRVKAKLGHETGAGAKCLVCDEKCPGLDLHFWRKTCKNCKCTKEEHDVHDDDIHGWAEWQLLGSKPNKIKTKITLPGRKDVLELDWAPKGNQETVENFLKSQPIEAIPVKGSKAAQERKQLLQKQIPIHDIDPTLCHDLTAEEFNEMNKYIAHIKEKSVGVGHLVNIGNIVKGVVHNMAPAQYQMLLDKYGKNIPLFEIVRLQDLEMCKGLEKMGLGKNMPNYAPKAHNTVNDNQMAANFDIYKDKIYGVNQRNDNANVLTPNFTNESLDSHNSRKVNAGLPHFIPENPNVFQSVQNPQNINTRVSRPTMSDNAHKANTGLPYFNAQNEQNPHAIGNIKDLAYSTYENLDELSPNHNQKVLKNKMAANIPIKPHEDYVYPENIQIGGILDVKMATMGENENYIDMPLPTEGEKIMINNVALPNCHYCKRLFDLNEFAVAIERSSCLYHANCFKCYGCNQILADNMYFYHKESNNIYCLRDYAKIKGYPRCKGCDELIFTKEYCLTEENTFHLKHFCCIDCDVPLAGQNYLLENSNPTCLPCYEKNNASKCQSCQKIIKPNEEGLLLKDKHFHVKDDCFCCVKCKKPLLNQKLLFRNDKLYCSHNCFQDL